MNSLSYEEIKNLIYCFNLTDTSADFVLSLSNGKSKILLNLYRTYKTIEFEDLTFYLPRFNSTDEFAISFTNKGLDDTKYFSYKFSDFDILINEDLEDLDDTMKDLIFRGNIPTFNPSIVPRIKSMIKIMNDLLEG